MDGPAKHNAIEHTASDCSRFYQARSECLDAFSTLEVASYLLAARLKIELSGKGQLSQVIKKLKGAPAGPQLSKNNASDLKVVCAQIMTLLEERADIVHSSMTIARENGDSVAFFRNAIAISNRSAQARAYEICMLSNVAENAKQLAKKLDAIRKPAPNKPRQVTPASSPQQPSPAATADP